MAKLGFGAILVAAVGALACGEEQERVVSGAAAIWLTSTEVFPAGESDRREVIDVSGVINAVAQSPAKPSADRHGIFATDYGRASEVVTFVDDAGIEWTLGYEIRRGRPALDVTPHLERSLVGKRARLLFRRGFWSFGVAAGFVLSDDAGVVLAMDLADQRQPLQPDDVPGLKIDDGSVLGVESRDPGHGCFDEEHRTLVFKADSSSEVRPGAETGIAIRGQRYAAHNIQNLRSVGVVRCTDVPTSYRGWAILRTP